MLRITMCLSGALTVSKVRTIFLHFILFRKKLQIISFVVCICHSPLVDADFAAQVNEFIRANRFKNKCGFKGHALKGQLITTEFLSQNKQIPP